MRAGKLSRRDVLKASGAAAMTVFATPLRAAPPEPTAITPALVEAATREGKVIYYTPIDLPVSERIAKAFEAKRKAMMEGKFEPFQGPVKDQSGAIKVAAGKSMPLSELMSLNYYVEGVDGTLPK